MKKTNLTLNLLSAFCFILALIIWYLNFPYLKIVFQQLNN